MPHPQGKILHHAPPSPYIVGVGLDIDNPLILCMCVVLTILIILCCVYTFSYTMCSVTMEDVRGVVTLGMPCKFMHAISLRKSYID